MLLNTQAIEHKNMLNTLRILSNIRENAIHNRGIPYRARIIARNLLKVHNYFE